MSSSKVSSLTCPLTFFSPLLHPDISGGLCRQGVSLCPYWLFEADNSIPHRYDNACSDSFPLNSGVGFSVGVVASVILFRSTSLYCRFPRCAVTVFDTGRTWPIALSTGFGAGAAYADCDRLFNPARLQRGIPLPSAQAPPSPSAKP
jgi:MICOS complex subunit MIC10